MPTPARLPRLSRRGLGLAALSAPRPGRAAAWPDRPLTLVVPFGAGAGNDITSRTLAGFLERELGQPVAVVNRPGAGGEIGLNAVADARADGYTLGNLSTPGVVTIPIERRPRWTLDSFEPIAGIVNDPAVIAVRPDSSIASIADLVEAARRQPGAVTVATQGLGSASHFSVRLLEMAAGVRFEPVTYLAGPQSILALAQRDVVASTANLGESMIMTAGQPWRPLGVMAPERLSLAPDLPTFREAAYDIEMGSLRGIGAPKGVPEPVLEVLSAAIGRVVADPEYRAACARTMQPISYLPRAEYSATLRRMDEAYRRMWQAAPWTR
ncbi:tripartite tricarboxylate transporter substrate binding protein [Pararoseomonas indoligenes]|uniref:Tripartite tricarboxylate transporter substrate binding protein n=1 Tax=Roseomonas indoligenes TaxID=2820811 RepID=A0A940N7X4_9PROT|nr:tripartite tricarboxylate transporter substrate binding protein [Pararoseomonas indoligenes]MBP0495712.1 tripartite tricarboxylate transporter substrate binding protein [Pararoseomonas indoligenes]